jgi:hypothetical protein
MTVHVMLATPNKYGWGVSSRLDTAINSMGWGGGVVKAQTE